MSACVSFVLARTRMRYGHTADRMVGLPVCPITQAGSFSAGEKYTKNLLEFRISNNYFTATADLAVGKKRLRRRRGGDFVNAAMRRQQRWRRGGHVERRSSKTAKWHAGVPARLKNGNKWPEWSTMPPRAFNRRTNRQTDRQIVYRTYLRTGCF